MTFHNNSNNLLIIILAATLDAIDAVVLPIINIGFIIVEVKCFSLQLKIENIANITNIKCAIKIE